MEETLFYVCGGALVLAALAVSAIGIRSESFPPSPGVMAAGVATFAALVAATTTFGVWNARTEQDHRRAELAETAAAEEEPAPAEEGEASEPAQPSGPATTLELTAPADGSLVFEPEQLEAKAGTVTIEFTNPAAVQHDVQIEADGETIGGSDLVANDAATEATAELEAGEYVYYCSVTGHREAGMEGALAVK
jgi:plastocyanin